MVVTFIVACRTSDKGYVVHKENIQWDNSTKWCEYFISLDNDTMATSFHFKDNSIGGLGIRIKCNEEMKEYQSWKDDELLKSDSIATAFSFPFKKYKRLLYPELLSQLDTCMKVAEKNFVLSRMKYIIVQIEDFPDIAIAVSRHLEKNNLYSHSTINSALLQTSFKSDLEKILQRYHLCVDKMSSQEIIFYENAEVYAKRYQLSKDTLPEKIVGVEVYVGLKSLNE